MTAISLYKTVQPKLDLASKISLVISGFVIPLSVTGIAIFLNLTVLLTILAGDFKKKFKSLQHNRVLLIALFIYLLLLISIPYSTAPWPDISTALYKYGKLLYLIFLMPLFAEEVWRRMGINAFLAAMVITLIASFLQMFGWIHIGQDLGGIFTNHINTGIMMAFAAFIVAHRCFEKNRVRWFYILLFFVMTFQIFFMNEGRTGYLVYVGLLLLFLYQKFHWKGLAVAVIATPLLFAALFFSSNTFKQRINNISQDYQRYQQQQLVFNSTGLRYTFIKHSVALIKEHPFVGTGIGSFRAEYKNHFPPDPGFVNMYHPQLDYLMITVQLGVIGLLVYLWLFFAEWRASFLLPDDLKNLAQGLVVAYMLGALCDTLLILAIPGFFFIYFSALFFSNYSAGAPQRGARKISFHKKFSP